MSISKNINLDELVIAIYGIQKALEASRLKKIVQEAVQQTLNEQEEEGYSSEQSDDSSSGAVPGPVHVQNKVARKSPEDC